MVTKGIYLFWDKKYKQVIYAGRFTGRKRIKKHFSPSLRNAQKINEYVQTHPNRIESVIFCEFDDISNNDLNQLEKETIKLFKLNKYRYPDSHVFNFTDGGEGICGFIHSEETRKKLSEANTGKILSEETKRKISENAPDRSGANNPMYGKNPSEETRQKMSEAHSGKNHSEETKKKMSEANSGENHPMYGKHPSEETRQKMSEAHSGKNNHNAKYTFWDITKCSYSKTQIFRNGNNGKNPRCCFRTKYNGKELPIGNNLDFYTPELINDLINESLEVD